MVSRMSRARGAAWAVLALALLTSGGTVRAQGFFDVFAPPPSQSGSEANEPLMTPEQRRAMQRELGNRGFYRGAINAALNRETRHAIALWQASIRAYPSGYLTRGQLASLLSAPPPQAFQPAPASPPPPVVQQAAPPAGTATTAPTAGMGAYDVVGLRLGMDLSDAQQIIDAHIPGNRILKVAPSDPGSVVLFGTARVHVAADNKEIIALVTQPEKSGSRVVAIGRYLFGGTDAYDREELIGDLAAKYGGQPLRSPPLLHWGGQASTMETICHLMMGGVDLGAWTDQDGKAPDWKAYAPPAAAAPFQGPGPMYWLGLRAPSLERLADHAPCGPTVAVYIPDSGRRASEFTLWLSDAKAYMTLLATPTALPAAIPTAPSAKPKL